MQNSLALELNKPGRIIRVFDSKVIHYCKLPYQASKLGGLRPFSYRT